MLVATNNSTRHPTDVVERLRSITGIDLPEASVVTSSMSVVRLLGDQDAPAFVVGESGLRRALLDNGVAITEDPTAARSVVVGLDRSFDDRVLVKATAAVLAGARLVGSNRDLTFPMEHGVERGAGAIVAEIERATATTAVYGGKPTEIMGATIVERLGPGETWMVGDRLDTDIAMGVAMGWTTVLVLTGVTGPNDVLDPVPDHVVGSVADVAELVTHSAEPQ